MACKRFLLRFTKPAFLMITVLILVAAGAIVALTFVATNYSVPEETTLVNAQVRAMMAAETGITIAVQRIREDPDGITTDGVNDGTWDDHWGYDGVVIELDENDDQVTADPTARYLTMPIAAHPDAVAIEVRRFDDEYVDPDDGRTKSQFNYNPEVYKITAVGVARDGKGVNIAFYAIEALAMIPLIDGDSYFSNLISSDGGAFTKDATLALITGGNAGWVPSYVPNNTFVQGSIYSWMRPWIWGSVTGHAFYEKPDMLDLGVPAGETEAVALGINIAGQLVGRAGIPAMPKAIVWEYGRFSTLGIIPGLDRSEAYDVNHFGQVVGASRNYDTEGDIDLIVKKGTSRAFVVNPADCTTDGDSLEKWYCDDNADGANDLMVDLSGYIGNLDSAGKKDQPKSFASAINGAGVIVGAYTSGKNGANPRPKACVDKQKAYGAYRLVPDGAGGYVLEDLCTLSSYKKKSIAEDINDSGLIVGRSCNDDDGRSGRGRRHGHKHHHDSRSKAKKDVENCHAFIWEEGVGMTDLGSLPGGDSGAYGINNKGQVVGNAEVNGVEAACVWDVGIVNLNTRIPAGSGWVLHRAYAINQSGQIVGRGEIGGEVHAFRLTLDPYDPPNYTIDDLGTIGGSQSEAMNINDAGEVVGYVATTGNTTNHPFVWNKDETVIAPATLDGTFEQQDVSGKARWVKDRLIRPTLGMFDYGWQNLPDEPNPGTPLTYTIDGMTFTADEITAANPSECWTGASGVVCKAAGGELFLGGSSKTNPANVLVANNVTQLRLNSGAYKIIGLGTIVADTIILADSDDQNDPIGDVDIHLTPGVPDFPSVVCRNLRTDIGAALPDGDLDFVVEGPALISNYVDAVSEGIMFRGFIVSNNTTSEPGFSAGQGFHHGLCPARFGIGCPADAFHWADPTQGVNGSGNATIYLLAEEDPDGDNVFTPVPWTRLKLINGQTDGGTPNLGVHPPEDEAPRVIQQRSAQPDIGFEAPFDFVNLEFVE